MGRNWIKKLAVVAVSAGTLSVLNQAPALAAITADDFNRADSASLGAAWTDVVGSPIYSPLKIANNRAAWTTSGNSLAGIALSNSSTGDAAAMTAYADPAGGTGQVAALILRYTSISSGPFGGLFGGAAGAFNQLYMGGSADGTVPTVPIQCFGAVFNPPVTSARVTFSLAPSITPNQVTGTVTADTNFDGTPEYTLSCDIGNPQGTSLGIALGSGASLDDFGAVAAPPPPAATTINVEKPKITQQPQTLEANTTGGFSGSATGVSATDGDNLNRPIHLANNQTGFLPLGTNYVHWVATDPDGDASEVYQRVDVVDTTKPTITCPADVNEPPGPGVFLGAPSVSDIADAHPTTSNNAPEEFTEHITPVTWTALDLSGNKSTCTQRVILGPQSLSLSVPDTGKAKKPIAVTGSVKPKGSLTSVQLQRQVNGKWVNANVLKVNPDGTISTKLTLKSKGTYVMRLIRPASKNKPEIVSNTETFVIS